MYRLYLRGNQAGGGLTQNTVEGPSSLPLDSTLIADLRPTPPPYHQETELETARWELEGEIPEGGGQEPRTLDKVTARFGLPED